MKMSAPEESSPATGAVPDWNTSKMASGLSVRARRPVYGSMRTFTRPGGRSSTFSGMSCNAMRMYSIHMGSAARAPVSRLPSGWKSSNPTHAIVAMRARFGAQVPAIVVTGSTMTGHDKEAQEQDFHILLKPVVPNKLRAMIAFKLGVKPAAAGTATT